MTFQTEEEKSRFISPALRGARENMATLNAIGIVVSDMKKALAFYRLLGLEIPEPAESEDHVGITLPGGMQLMWDPEELVKSFDPDWTRPIGNRVGLGF